MPIEIYSTRNMMQAIERMKPARTFLRDTFFSDVQTSVTEKIDVDFKKGKRKMAPFVAPRVGGVTMDRQGFRTQTYSVPKIAPQRIMTVDDISTRAMGESVYSPRTPEERAAELLGRDLAELEEDITRREEWMCRELLLNGKIVMKGYIDIANNQYIEQEVDFGFTNTEVLTGESLWSSGNADIHGYLKNKRLGIIQSTGIAPDVVIMASNVVDAFLKDPEIQTIYNLLRFDIGNIAPRIINPAVTRITFITDLNLDVYSYDEWFLDDNGIEQPMLPPGKVIMARTGMGKRLYGAITQIDNGAFVTYESTRIPKNWVDVNNDTKMVRVSSRPLPVPEDVDDWHVMTVL